MIRKQFNRDERGFMTITAS